MCDNNRSFQIPGIAKGDQTHAMVLWCIETFMHSLNNLVFTPVLLKVDNLVRVSNKHSFEACELFNVKSTSLSELGKGVGGQTSHIPSGIRTGVNSILAMPEFWKRMLLPDVPERGENNLNLHAIMYKCSTKYFR